MRTALCVVGLTVPEGWLPFPRGPENECPESVECARFLPPWYPVVLRAISAGLIQLRQRNHPRSEAVGGSVSLLSAERGPRRRSDKGTKPLRRRGDARSSGADRAVSRYAPATRRSRSRARRDGWGAALLRHSPRNCRCTDDEERRSKSRSGEWPLLGTAAIHRADATPVSGGRGSYRPGDEDRTRNVPDAALSPAALADSVRTEAASSD